MTTGDLQTSTHIYSETPVQNNHPVTVHSWWRTQSATMALLKHAYKIIHTAEDRITQQEKRIKTLEAQVQTDDMTGLYNRRGFELTFDREKGRINRNKSNGGLLIILDMDGFKLINDTYGHLAGDEALKLVGDILRKSIRSQDAAARLGGDEFAVMLVDIDKTVAIEKALQIQERLNALTMEWQGKIINLGASAGFSTYTGECDFCATFEKADLSLYEDKRLNKLKEQKKNKKTFKTAKKKKLKFLSFFF